MSFPRVGQRVEVTDRPRFRQSPLRTSPAARELHNGLVFHGTTMVHTGGKSHANSPHDHREMLLPPKEPCAAPIYSASKTLDQNIYILPHSKRDNNSPMRPRPGDTTTPSTPRSTGKRHHDGGDPQNPIAHDFTITSSPRLSPRLRSTGVRSQRQCDSRPNTGKERRAPRSTASRTPPPMEGPPKFVAPEFVKRPYSPHHRQVEVKPHDNGVFYSEAQAQRPPNPHTNGKALDIFEGLPATTSLRAKNSELALLPCSRTPSCIECAVRESVRAAKDVV